MPLMLPLAAAMFPDHVQCAGAGAFLETCLLHAGVLMFGIVFSE
jgi:hypothetical protein